MALKTEVYKDKRGEFRWRKTGANGKIVGSSSESYKKKADCEANAKRRSKSDKWEFYKDKRGEFRWRRVASNGAIVGASSESFKSRKGATTNAGLLGYKP